MFKNLDFILAFFTKIEFEKSVEIKEFKLNVESAILTCGTFKTKLFLLKSKLQFDNISCKSGCTRFWILICPIISGFLILPLMNKSPFNCTSAL